MSPLAELPSANGRHGRVRVDPVVGEGLVVVQGVVESGEQHLPQRDAADRLAAVDPVRQGVGRAAEPDQLPQAVAVDADPSPRVRRRDARDERVEQSRRIHDAGDRRQVIIEPTSAARATVDRIWGPIGTEARRRLSRRASDELTLIRDFLAEGSELQTRHAQRIKDADD
jgi:hypothetical protein